MTENLPLIMMTYFIVKHYLCDFPARVQTPWMFMNKGTYGHPGGIAHALVQAAASVPIFLWAMTQVIREPSHPLMDEFNIILFLFTLEFLVHYHMDWFKMWWCDRCCHSGYVGEVVDIYPGDKQYPPHLAIYNNKYFTWLGIDQLVHYLTYVGMTWIYVS